MGIKTYNPYTPSRRNMTGSDFSEITKSTPEKSLLAKKSKNAGRNNQGKITVRHHGGGNRQKYRMIDFKRNKEGVPAQVIGIEYDPNRTANIALICYADGEKAYILAPQGLTDGMTVQNGAGAEVCDLSLTGPAIAGTVLLSSFAFPEPEGIPILSTAIQFRIPKIAC